MTTPERRCPNGHPAAPGAAFCTRCGVALDAPPPLGFVTPPAPAPAPSPAGYAAAPPPPPYAAPHPPAYAVPLGAPAAPYAWDRPPFSGYAIAAFIVSLVWLYAITSIAAIVLGVIALRHMAQRPQRGRALAIWAIVLGGIGIVIAVGILLGHTS